MKCPRCGTPELVHRELGERERIGVEQCPRCRGCWVGVHALERIEAGVWARVDGLDFDTAEALSALSCPHCAARLVTVSPHDHAELDIDRCPTCHGLWLDPGELDALHTIALEQAEAQGGLQRRPDGWSRLRWVSYRVAEHWRQTREE